MKKGLVLEGGAMRGMFTCGVLDVFMRENIVFDGAVGVSAGAVFGCNIKSQQIGRALRYNKRFCNDRRYASFSNLIKTGNLYETDFCYRQLPYELDVFDTDTFKANPMEFYVTATDVTTGKAVYHKCLDGRDHDLQWFRASASMPMLSEVVEIGDYRLLDGGVADSIPLRFLEGKGYDRNVVILTQPSDYHKEPNQFVPLARVLLRKYPALIDAMKNRHLMYNETLGYIRKKEAAGEILVIRPPVSLNIGSKEKDPAELQRVYDIGAETAKAQLQAVKAFLS